MRSLHSVAIRGLLPMLLAGLLAGALPPAALGDDPPPPDWELGENWPEPFCPGVETTHILIGLAEAAHVELKVWNPPMTALLKTLVDEVLDLGYHEIVWDGLLDGSLEPVPPGTYPYTMVAYYEGEPENPLFDAASSLTAYCEPTPTPRETWAAIKLLFR
jgi:hypothetical protein